MEQSRARGESIVYRAVRSGNEVLCFDPRKRLYDIAREVITYLNRDRREIVFIEDRMIQAERRLVEVSKLCGLLIGNLEWCRENMEESDAREVDVWARRARKLMGEIMGEKWK